MKRDGEDEGGAGEDRPPSGAPAASSGTDAGGPTADPGITIKGEGTWGSGGATFNHAWLVRPRLPSPERGRQRLFPRLRGLRPDTGPELRQGGRLRRLRTELGQRGRNHAIVWLLLRHCSPKALIGRK